MTYQHRHKKYGPALYVQAGIGYKPREKKPRKPVPKRSKRQSRLDGLYNREVRAWKKDRLCICAGLRDSTGKPICKAVPHLCEHNHHSKGRRHLLNDKRWWKPVCSESHFWIENNKREARALGLYEGAWQHVLEEKKV